MWGQDQELLGIWEGATDSKSRWSVNLTNCLRDQQYRARPLDLSHLNARGFQVGKGTETVLRATAPLGFNPHGTRKLTVIRIGRMGRAAAQSSWFLLVRHHF